MDTSVSECAWRLAKAILYPEGEILTRHKSLISLEGPMPGNDLVELFYDLSVS